MTRRARLLLSLAGLCLLDLVVPVPVLGLTAVYVVLERPPWFRKLVDEVYALAPR